MISFLRGSVAEKTLTSVVVDVSGIGYECGVSSTTSSALPPAGSGQECTVYTHMQVREDAVSLFGFATTAEREAFRKLVGITGVGPKLALSVLSTFTPEALRSVVAAGDEKRMATIPGVGKKTASRMLLELKDVFKDDLFTVGAASDDGALAKGAGVVDAAAALLSMGFSSAECDLALSGYAGPADDVQSVVKYALRRLGSVG